MWIISRIIAVKFYLILVLIMVDEGVAMAAENGGPVRVWGDLSSTYRVRQTSSGDVSNTNWRNTGTVNASSYIWRPWFALINGGLSLTLEETDETGQADANDQFTTGNVQFDLFPTSRFPFRAYFRESRDEFDNQAFDQTIATTEYGLRQQYRSRDGTDNYRAEYDHDEQDRDGRDQFVSESLLLRAVNRSARQSLETDLKLDKVDDLSTDQQGESHSITLDHNYGKASSFTLDNLASSSRIESDFFDSNSEVETAQVSSFMSWHPGERRDLRITGSLRAAETRTVEQDMAIQPRGEFESETENLNLNQGLLYSYSDNLRFNESINLGSIETDGEVVSIESLSLGGLYSSDRIESRFGNYGWNAGSTYSSLSGDVEEEESLDNQFSHSLSDTYLLDNGYQLRTNLTQSLNYDYESVREDEKRIDHSYSMTWSSAAINRQNQIRFFISDSRELNQDNDYFNLINFQYTGTSRLTRYTQLSGNATLQYTNQSSEGNRSELISTNGRLRYRHSRLFQTPGLTFESELLVSERRREAERLTQDTGEGTQVSWENSLVYRVGRLETRADLDFIKVGNDYDYLIKLELKRSFGDL